MLDRDMKIAMMAIEAGWKMTGEGFNAEYTPYDVTGEQIAAEMKEEAQAVVAAIPPEPAGVPEGWRLVPVEPTPEMLGAGLRHVDGWASMPAAYRAMLAAAPQANQPSSFMHVPSGFTFDTVLSAVDPSDIVPLTPPQIEQPASVECTHCEGFGEVSGEYPGIGCPACNGTGKEPAQALTDELVAALQYLVDECDDDMDDDYNPHAAPLARARAIIAKAKGGAK